MSKICEFTLSADVFTTKQNFRKHSTVHFYKEIKSEFFNFFGPLFLFRFFYKTYITVIWYRERQNDRWIEEEPQDTHTLTIRSKREVYTRKQRLLIMYLIKTWNTRARMDVVLKKKTASAKNAKEESILKIKQHRNSLLLIAALN